MGFEPTRAEPIGLAVQRLNHSATSSHAMRHSTSGITIHLLVEDIKIASAGNRTRINCLEGSYADHYTTDASCYLTSSMYHMNKQNLHVLDTKYPSTKVHYQQLGDIAQW